MYFNLAISSNLAYKQYMIKSSRAICLLLFTFFICCSVFSQAPINNIGSWQKPPLVSRGEEGPFTDEMIEPGRKIKLYILFIDWPDAKGNTRNFDSLWRICTSNGKLFSAFKEQGKEINFSVEARISKKWQTLPKASTHYFPPDSADGIWNWTDYIKDCPAFLPSAFGLDKFSENSVLVVVPSPAVSDKWKTGVPTGNLPIKFHGIKYMISLHPYEKEGYRTLMHEIGHCYGTDELYSIPNDASHSEIWGLDMMGDDYFATGFMGYHRYRYGWMPFKPENPSSVYLTKPGSYELTLRPLSARNGIKMILIPDGSVSTDSLKLPHKLWGIEVSQDIQKLEQAIDGRNEKIAKEGDYIIIYTVEAEAQPGKRLIRLVSKTGRLTQENERWSTVFLYKDGENFQHADAPMEIKIQRNKDGSYNLKINKK